MTKSPDIDRVCVPPEWVTFSTIDTADLSDHVIVVQPSLVAVDLRALHDALYGERDDEAPIS